MNLPSKRLLALLIAGLLSVSGIGLALGDDDEDEGGERGERGERQSLIQPAADITPAANPVYAEECGSCHLAYQPGLLPAAAWTQVMEPAALASHYGDDATLPEATRTALAAYLAANAADQAGATKRAQAFAETRGSLIRTGETLPRITETRYFKRKHDEIPARLVTGNPEVGSFSQCNRCHQKAEAGVYNEDQVNIPGHGPWED